MRRAALLMLVALASGLTACAPRPTSAAATGASQDLAFTGLVVDQASVIDPAARARLTVRLDKLQKVTAHQFAVVTVSDLHGQRIEDFSLALGNRWGVGRKGYDDGVLLIVAPNERNVRIEVGHGLQATLTEAFCATVMRNDILPAFRRHDLTSGIEAGVAAIIRKLDPSGRA